MPQSNIKFAYFGTAEFAATVLDELEKAGFLPSLIVTAPDRPVGRHLVMTPPAAKIWADAHGIPTLQPSTLKTEEFFNKLKKHEPADGFDLFIVASYGKLIPQTILDMPKHGTINVHPSLLPKLRGASPIQSAILEEDTTGVSIMLLDAEMDHGPLLAQEEIEFPHWPPKSTEAEDVLAHRGGKLLASVIEPWIKGEIKAMPQDHSKATFCKKITKEDGLLDLSADPALNYRKIQAFAGWPTAYYFLDLPAGKRIRIIVKDAELIDDKLILKRVVPEGKKEMDYEDFMRNQPGK